MSRKVKRKQKYITSTGIPLKKVFQKRGKSRQPCDNCELSNYPSKCSEMDKNNRYVYDCYERDYAGAIKGTNPKVYIFIKK